MARIGRWSIILQKAAYKDLKVLTSLRFFAALMIVALHVSQSAPARWNGWFPASSIHGVSFFFVLSGFILTHVYEGDGELNIARFMTLRVARIYPTVVASMALTFMVLPWEDIVRPGTGAEIGVAALALKALMLDALVPVTNVYFAGNSPSWSISTEMTFYILFPVLLKRFRSDWLQKLLLAAVCAAAVYSIGYVLALSPGVAADNRVTLVSLGYANPLVRGFEFVLGMSTYLLWSRSIEPLQLSRRNWTQIECAALFIVAIWLAFDVETVFSALPSPISLWFGTSGSCFAFAALISIFASGRGWVGEFLARRPFVWLGEVSFAIYMYHQIVLRALKPVLLPDFGAGLFVLAALSATLAIAAANHRWVEPHGRKLILSLRSRLSAGKVAISLADAR